MSPIPRKYLRAQVAAMAVLWGLAFAPAVEACSVPVFRWALERWQADDYELLVFHEGPLSDADRAMLGALDQRIADAKAPANLHVRDIDAAQPIDEPHAEIAQTAQKGSLPACFLMYPRGTRATTPVWSGALSELPLDVLLDSPLRREAARRLLDGHSGVWLLLRSGDHAKDDAAAQVLAETIERANKTLRLPDMSEDGTLEGPDPPDVSNLRVEFSMLEVGRDDPGEAALVRMLLGSEPDLVDYHEPMAFPVYGRGRILYALVGRGISAGNVLRTNAFLVGECACEIKAQNPGTDLLMPVDWEKRIGDNSAIREVVLPPLPGTALTASGGVHDRTKPQQNEAGAIAVSPVLRNAAYAVAAVVIFVAAGTILRLVRRRGVA